MTSVLVHVGYGLMLCALAARDILWLRGILVAAQSVLSLYAWQIGVPSIAAWNALFVVINTVWVIKILHDRRAVALPPDLQPLYDRHFFALTPSEFLRWWRQGRRTTLRDAVLTTEGQFPEALYFLLDGAVRVTRNGAHLTDLEAGHFVGEMSLITGRPATADAVSVGQAEVMRWDAKDLHAIRTGDPQLWTRIQSAIGQDLVVKIGRQASSQPAR